MTMMYQSSLMKRMDDGSSKEQFSIYQWYTSTMDFGTQHCITLVGQAVHSIQIEAVTDGVN